MAKKKTDVVSGKPGRKLTDAEIEARGKAYWTRERMDEAQPVELETGTTSKAKRKSGTTTDKGENDG